MVHVTALPAENELDAVEFQTPIFSTKGSEGKKISMHFYCMHRKTDKKKPRQGY